MPRRSFRIAAIRALFALSGQIIVFKERLINTGNLQLGRKPSTSSHPPTRHTVLIGDVGAMWEKMYWDTDVFLDIQRSYPEERQPLVYAALNACISAKSLEDWAKRIWKQNIRSRKQSEANDFCELISQMIPAQDLCADIANTTKHAGYRDGRWPGGSLNLRWDEGDEFCPPGLVLQKSTQDASTLLFDDLSSLPADWWAFLCKLNLVSGDRPTPAWWQNKIGRMFGSASMIQT